MSGLAFGAFNRRLLSRTYALSFPLAMAAVLYLRVRYGYTWPLPRQFGLIVVLGGLSQLPWYFALPSIDPDCRELRRQAVYSGVWMLLLGLWLYAPLFGDWSLTVLIAIAAGLWPASHAQFLRLQGRV